MDTTTNLNNVNNEMVDTMMMSTPVTTNVGTAKTFSGKAMIGAAAGGCAFGGAIATLVFLIRGNKKKKELEKILNVTEEDLKEVVEE